MDTGLITPERTKTIPELVRAMAAAYGQREAVVLGDEALTYEDLDLRSARLARGLLGRGVGKGNRIGMLFGNGPRWVVWWAAISRIGAIAVPLSTFARFAELARTISHADLHGVVFQQTHLKRDFVTELERAIPSLAESSPELRLTTAPFLRWAVVVRGEQPRWARSTEWLNEQAVPDELFRASESEVHVDDPAIMIYTSGTSSTPKGIVHTQGTVVQKTHYLRKMLGYHAESEHVAASPFFWVGGLVMSLFTGMEAGGRVTCHDTSTRRTTVPIGSSSKRSWTVAPNAVATPALGMTETFGMYSWGWQLRADGYPVCAPLDEFEPGYTVEVVDEAGRPAADGEIGEIIIRGPTLTRQLVKVARSNTFTQDGFYRTGDRGLRDGSRIHFVGRLTDMIKTSGANVAPPEVEQELLQVDGVAAAYVTGVDDPERDQEVVAAIVLEDDVQLSGEAVRAMLGDRLSSYKVPRRIAILSDADIPLTAASKVNRASLGALINERVPRFSSAPGARS